MVLSIGYERLGRLKSPVSGTGNEGGPPLGPYRLAGTPPTGSDFPLPYRVEQQHGFGQNYSSASRPSPYQSPPQSPPQLQKASAFISQPTSTRITRTATAPPVFATVTDPDMGTIDESKFEALETYDTIFIIDDTGSMQKPLLSYSPEGKPVVDRWAALVVGLQVFAKIASKYDKDGIDIAFLKNVHLNKESRGLKDVNSVKTLLSKINLSDPLCGGGTIVKEQLLAAIDPRMKAFREFVDKKKRNPYGTHTLPKPLNLVVVTDGEADDEVEVEEYIVSVARELAELRAPKSYIGIQFVQIGDEVEAAEYLRRLDDDLKTSHRTADGKPIRDVSDREDELVLEANEKFRLLILRLSGDRTLKLKMDW